MPSHRARSEWQNQGKRKAAVNVLCKEMCPFEHGHGTGRYWNMRH